MMHNNEIMYRFLESVIMFINQILKDLQQEMKLVPVMARRS